MGRRFVLSSALSSPLHPPPQFPDPDVAPTYEDYLRQRYNFALPGVSAASEPLLKAIPIEAALAPHTALTLAAAATGCAARRAACMAACAAAIRAACGYASGRDSGDGDHEGEAGGTPGVSQNLVHLVPAACRVIMPASALQLRHIVPALCVRLEALCRACELGAAITAAAAAAIAPEGAGDAQTNAVAMPSPLALFDIEARARAEREGRPDPGLCRRDTAGPAAGVQENECDDDDDLDDGQREADGEASRWGSERAAGATGVVRRDPAEDAVAGVGRVRVWVEMRALLVAATTSRQAGVRPNCLNSLP